MPTDWLAYWMTRPWGLVLVAVAVALPFGLWRLVLGHTHSAVGFKPLVLGYLCAGAGSAVLAFTSSYFEFSERVANGVLPESQRWSIVPGWSVYLGVLSLTIVLPLLGLIGVPFSAVLVRRRCLTIKTIIVSALVCWLFLATFVWMFPGNEWHRTHRFESFTVFLSALAPGMVLIALPFLLAVHRASSSFRHAET
jgi:hypothetical protein